MRLNQVNIIIQRFGDQVPYGAGDKMNPYQQTINVYSDANNIFEAVAIAFSETMKAINVHQEASIGRADHSFDNNHVRKWLDHNKKDCDNEDY